MIESSCPLWTSSSVSRISSCDCAMLSEEAQRYPGTAAGVLEAAGGVRIEWKARGLVSIKRGYGRNLSKYFRTRRLGIGNGTLSAALCQWEKQVAMGFVYFRAAALSYHGRIALTARQNGIRQKPHQCLCLTPSKQLPHAVGANFALLQNGDRRFDR